MRVTTWPRVAIGLTGLLPALLIVAGGVLHSLFGYSALGDAISGPNDSAPGRLLEAVCQPAVVLSGAAVAILLNGGPLLRIGNARPRGGPGAPAAAEPSDRLSLAVAVLGLLLVATLFVYLLVENLPAESA